MNYQTYCPKQDLEEIVKCFWTLEGPCEKNADKQRIVPDGCMEMIFHYGDLYRQYLSENESIVQPRCFVFGQITTALEIEPTGSTGIFAVRFHPHGFNPIATLPISMLENRATPLEVLFGEDGLKLAKDVLSAVSTVDRISVCEKFLLSRLLNPDAVAAVVKSSVGLIMELNGQLSIEAVSRQVRINRRNLERKFSSAIGLSPKQLSKIIRLQATLKMLAGNRFTSLTSVAHEGEFYDQAHFIKDFKEFTGLSPKQFFSKNLKMSSFFYGT